ncbi:armadillo-type protein [Phycomyces blakesleeanus]|uniref:PUM-HD domain-containing protein n=2 Tax=Phycomyces blakesleeanus TaxID=4837 RepID=A0A163AYT7_PHYB8|nr:hypothetical protein PHYBLDRAFT_165165 [Phycomyces blakesleeanus NRRL 1555(-)]OAD76641.1 hypothetical protein PHYBLDRAFT_165165 [Phycomyces blakesleeanus NRRL 1555(-)]|eukprot:XP_018294681.1 hypothetical protein PHYBLDRAFT_165165 [Phycomyces blakesleeanus NRRL 1555(-)]
MDNTKGTQGTNPYFPTPPLSSRHLSLDLSDSPVSFNSSRNRSLNLNCTKNQPESLWPTSVTKRSSMVGDRRFGTRLIPDPGRPRAISLDVSMRPEFAPSSSASYYCRTSLPFESHQQSESMATIVSSIPRPFYQLYKKSVLNPIVQEERLESPTPTPTPTRSLWLGNISSSVTAPDIAAIFDCYGPIESIRIIFDRECAFVNFAKVEDAIEARSHFQPQADDPRLGHVKLGFGNPENPIPLHEPPARQPTRALWIGNIPSTITPTMLYSVFAPFGPIQSVRILGHRNCGFVNFQDQQDAQAAKSGLTNKELFGCAIRLGYAKAPSCMTGSEDQNNRSDSSLPSNDPNTLIVANNGSPASLPLSVEADHQDIIRMLSFPSSCLALCVNFVANNDNNDDDTNTNTNTNKMISENERCTRRFKYSSFIPAAPEFGQLRQVDTGHLRDVRRRLDTGQVSTDELEELATMCLEDFIALCSDPIGNMIVQHIFERCCESTRTFLLEMTIPHLASIGVHKNGTWAAQKIIETAFLPEKVCASIKPFVPLLLLDQFGNYVVQCCLGLGPDYNQFIFDAIVDTCWEISQGRFGARAVRATLENPQTTMEQQIYVAAALIQHSLSLITNPNGSLLLIWLLDNSEISRRYSAVVPRLLPNIGRLCSHKLASLTILKIIYQDQDIDARQLLLDRLFYDDQNPQVNQILVDQVHGVGFIQRLLSSSLDLSERRRIADHVWLAMLKNELYQIQGYKRLLEEISMLGVIHPLFEQEDFSNKSL